MKKLFENENFIISILCLPLTVQVYHTLYVFNANSHYHNIEWLGWCYAIGIDIAILAFTVNARIWIAIGYFAGTLITNTVYLFYPKSIYSQLLIIVMLSSTVYSFSHLFVWLGKIKEKQKQKEQSKQEAEVIAEAKKLGIEIVALAYKCPVCGEGFVNTKKLNGHISAHKTKNQWVIKNPNWEQENLERAAFVSNLAFISN